MRGGKDGNKKKTKQRRECRAPARLKSGEHIAKTEVCRELWETRSSSHCPKVTYRKGREKKKLTDLSPQGSPTTPVSARVRQLAQSQALWLPPSRNEEHTEKGWT